MKIDRKKISDIGLIAMALIEQQKQGQLCPPILSALHEVAQEQLITKDQLECEKKPMQALVVITAIDEHEEEAILKEIREILLGECAEFRILKSKR